MTDYGFRQYNVLRTRVLGAHDHNSLVSVCSRTTEFVQQEDTNPVYAETLVNMLMHRSLTVIETMAYEEPNTYATMAIRRIATNVSATVSAWRAIMESNNGSAPEG